MTETKETAPAAAPEKGRPWDTRLLSSLFSAAATAICGISSFMLLTDGNLRGAATWAVLTAGFGLVTAGNSKGVSPLASARLNMFGMLLSGVGFIDNAFGYNSSGMSEAWSAVFGTVCFFTGLDHLRNYAKLHEAHDNAVAAQATPPENTPAPS